LPKLITGQGGPSVPTEQTQYVCDVCSGTHGSMTVAVLCEEQGRGLEYPVGLIFADHRPLDPDGTTNPRADRTFAVAENRVAGHHNWFACYVIGDPPSAVDVVPPRMCGHLHAGRLTAEEAHVDPARPSLYRLAAALRAEGIKPQVWDGRSAVSWDQWAAAHPGARK
jgi:hypothetical protein